MKILITGVAGFIGFHVAYAALKRGDQVIGIDNLNDYYDPSLKEDRLQQLNSLVKDINGKFTFIKGDIADLESIEQCFEEEIDRVTTPRGCTIAGLNEMEHKGFSSAMIKGIVTSSKKARQLIKPNK